MRACVRCFQTYQSVLDQMPPERGGGSVGRYHQGPEFGQVEDRGASPSPARTSRRPSIDQQVATINSDQVSTSTGASHQRKISKVVCPDNVMEEGQDVKITQEITELEAPETLRRLWSRVVDPEVGVRRDTHRSYFSKYPDTFQGRTLMEWLAHHDISSSHSQGLVIGQAFLTAGLMTPVSSRGQFSGATELYRPAASVEAEATHHSQVYFSVFFWHIYFFVFRTSRTLRPQRTFRGQLGLKSFRGSALMNSTTKSSYKIQQTKLLSQKNMISSCS